MNALPLEAVEHCYFCRAPLGPEVLRTAYTDLWPNPGGQTFRYRPCAACRLVILADRPAYGPELEAFYARQGGCAAFDPTSGNLLVRWLTRRLQARKLAVLRRVTGVEAGMRVLEVGCGRGPFAAYLAAQVGCEVHGNDLYPLEALPGVQYHPGPFSAGLFPPDLRFDLIVAHHVIEHVYDPQAFLADAHALLKPGGTLVVETVNHECATFRRFGEDWGLLCAPRHTVLFSAAFFEGLRGPFAEVRVAFDGYARAVSPLAQSLVHRLRLPLARSGAAKVLAFGLFALLNPWLAPLEIGLGLGRAVITVAARRA